jgi:hypothetical protein
VSWQLAIVAAVCIVLVKVLTAVSMSLGVLRGCFKLVSVSTVSVYNFQLKGYLIKDCGFCFINGFAFNNNVTGI